MTEMEEQWTCGKGLAAHSPLPAALGELMAAVATVLEVHTRALDLTDDNSRKEHGAYRRLVTEHREIAARLGATADAMAGYRDLPMGRHDAKAMAAPEAAQAFGAFVAIEEKLLALLQRRLKDDREMLLEMGNRAR